MPFFFVCQNRQCTLRHKRFPLSQLRRPEMQRRGENGRSCFVNSDENVPSGKQFSELPTPLIFRQAGEVYSFLSWLIVGVLLFSPFSSKLNQAFELSPDSAFLDNMIVMNSDQLLGRRRGAEEHRQDQDGDSIRFWAGQKLDLQPGKVERLQARALGSGVPVPPNLGTKQVEMGSSHWPETLERRRGSGVG